MITRRITKIMNDAEFLDELELRIKCCGISSFTDSESLRLWTLGTARIPPAHIRREYLRDRFESRIQAIREYRVRIAVDRLMS